MSIKKKLLPIIFILAVVAISIRQCSKWTSFAPTAGELNRSPSHVNYSKHARCRMDCRHVTETEVLEILKDGKIDYTKSELQGDDCHKRYAVEGRSRDNQQLRIIFAPCHDEETVVTVIDLGKEWPCNCE